MGAEIEMKAVPNETRQQNITFNYKDCAHKTLGDALTKLNEFTGWKDSKDLLRFAKLNAAFQGHAKQAAIWYRKLLKKHAVHDIVKDKDGKVTLGANGLPVTKPRWAPNPSQGGQMDFVFPDRVAFEKDYAVMAAYEFTVKVYRWTAEELHAAGLTAAELQACAKLLEDKEDLVVPDEDAVTEDNFECPVDMDLTPMAQPEPAASPAATPAPEEAPVGEPAI